MKKSRTTRVIASICFGLMLGVSLLTGCTLITKDMAKYYNTVVASFSYEDGTTVEITKKELITAYGQYGYQYVQNYDMEAKEAYNETLERVIESKLTVKEAEKIAKEANAGEILTEDEKTYLWNKTFDAIQDNIISYYNEINGISDDDDDDSNNSTTDGVEQETYSPTAIVVKQDGTYTVKLKTSTANEIKVYLKGKESTPRDFTNANDADVLYTYVDTFVKENPIYSSAYRKYYDAAKQSENGMKLSTDKKSVMQREFERIYNILYESLMTDKYSEAHESDNASATINHVLKVYKNRVKSDYNKYITENASGYDDAILEDVGGVNYYKTSSEGKTEYFYVSHILAKFSDTQQADYDKYTKTINEETDEESIGYAQTKIDQLYDNLAFKVREYDKESGKWVDTGKTKSVKAVLEEVTNRLAEAGDDEYLKAEYFEEFVYKYNDDEGIQNADRNYVVGVDYTTPDAEKGTSYTVNSNWVDEFYTPAVELYDSGKGKIGNISGLERSSYGIHIIIYEGKVENLFTGIDKDFKLTTSDIETLISDKARLKAGIKKTVFDDIFDEINTDRYSIYESMDLTRLRDEVSIKYYRGRYEDLYK